MNWHQRPECVDRLAAEYALGTLKGGARRRFEAVMQAHPAVARAAARWHERLAPIDAQIAPLPAGDALWARIEEQAFGAPAKAAAPRSSWWQRWLAPIPAGALAVGLLAGVALPPVWQTLQGSADETQLPESYVGVLATPDGRPGLVVSSLRRGLTVDLKQLQPVAVPAGRTLFLWALDGAGVAQPVGPIPSGAFVSARLGRPADEVFARAVELAVTLEAAGATPSAPAQPYVYRGLCGKLWRVPAQR